MFTLVFWKATLERALAGAASAVLTVLTVGGVAGSDGNAPINAFLLDYRVLAGVFCGALLVQVLVALTAQSVSKNGPGFGNAEVLNPAAVKAETGAAPTPPDYEVPADAPRGEAG